MKNPKTKGSQFERSICKALSLWVTHGKHEDVYWRSAMSGGRATVAHKRSIEQSNAAGRRWPDLPPVRQAGDITAVAPEGYVFTNQFFIECKHVKKLDIASFILDDRGALAKFWRVACKQAREHMRQPLLIAKENNREPLVICRPRGLRAYCDEPPKTLTPEIRFLSDLLKARFPTTKGG